MIDISSEDYLRTAYSVYEGLEDKKKGIRSVDIAKNLNISKPSVSAMIKKLAGKKYLKAAPYSNIHFTKKGLKEAKKLTRKYRVIEVFLTQVLKSPPNKIRKEAHKLEHAFSEESINRLYGLLHNPKLCPHGKKINM